MTEETGLIEKLRSFIGAEASAPATARDPVNQPMIRRWAEAMGDKNPLWHDPEARRAAGFEKPVAPPAMIDVWLMPPYRPSGRSADENMKTLDMLDEAGFTGVVAVNVEQEYVRYLQEGDIVSSRAVLTDVSDEKKTGLGTGHFVTWRHEFTDQQGEIIARQTFRVLKFRPPEKKPDVAPAGEAEAPKKFPHPRPAITHDNAFFWEGLKQRKLLIQRFGNRLVHPPTPVNPDTGSPEWDTVEATGRGTIHSFVIMHQPKLPGFEYPLPIVLVELEEGVRIVANMIDAKPADVAIGKAVTIDFVEVEPDYVLPAFRLA